VRAILKELPPKTPVAYLGDDLTDEDAFLALGNAGLTVLVRPELRPTAAELWIKPPQELTLFFETWLDACGGGS
jgi:trehalose-6-phosphatase